MTERYWLEKSFKEVFDKISSDFEVTEEKSKKIGELFKSTFDEIVEDFERTLCETAPQTLKEQQETNRVFKKEINERWHEAFDLLEIFIGVNHDFSTRIAESYRKVNNKDIKFETLFRLQARSCQISKEILELLKGGFADGAIARWRTLYEISVIATFLSDKPEKLIQKYMDYYFVENYNEIKEYQKNYEKLGFEPLDEEIIDEARKNVEFLKSRYGKEFGDNYGWASDYLEKGKRHFAGVEETVEFKELRSFYKMANNNIHGGIKAIIHKLGLYKQEEIIIAAPTNYGFADPGQFTAVSLLQVTSLLTQFENCWENELYIRVAENLCRKLSQSFVTIQKKLEIDHDNFTENLN